MYKHRDSHAKMLGQPTSLLDLEDQQPQDMMIVNHTEEIIADQSKISSGRPNLQDIMASIDRYNDIIAGKIKELADAKYAPTTSPGDLISCYAHLKYCCNELSRKLVVGVPANVKTDPLYQKLLSILRRTHSLMQQMPVASCSKLIDKQEHEVAAFNALGIAHCVYHYGIKRVCEMDVNDHVKAIDTLEASIAKFDIVYYNNHDPEIVKIRSRLLAILEISYSNFCYSALCDATNNIENIPIIEKALSYLEKDRLSCTQLRLYSPDRAEHVRETNISLSISAYANACYLYLQNKDAKDSSAKAINAYEHAIILLSTHPAIHKKNRNYLLIEIYRVLGMCYQQIGRLYEQVIHKIIKEKRTVADEESLLNLIASHTGSKPIDASIALQHKLAIYKISLAKECLDAYLITNDVKERQKVLEEAQAAINHALKEGINYRNLFKEAKNIAEKQINKLINAQSSLPQYVYLEHVVILLKLGDHSLEEGDKERALSFYVDAATYYNQVEFNLDMAIAEKASIAFEKALNIIDTHALPQAVADAKRKQLTQARAAAQRRWESCARLYNKLDLGMLFSRRDLGVDDRKSWYEDLFELHTGQLKKAIVAGDIDTFYQIIDHCNFPDTAISSDEPEKHDGAFYAKSYFGVAHYVALYARDAARRTFEFALRARDFRTDWGRPLDRLESPLEPKDSEAYLLEESTCFVLAINLMILEYLGINMQRGANLLYLKSKNHSPAPSHLDKTAEVLLPKTQCKPVWYTDEDINNLLSLAVRTIFKGYEEKCTYKLKGEPIVALTPAVDSAGKSVAINFFIDRRVAGNPTDVFDEIMPALQAKPKESVRIIFPYNLTRLHWLTGEIVIEKNQDTYLVKFFAHDPLGYGQISEANQKLLSKSFRERITSFDARAKLKFVAPPSPYRRRQAIGDTVSCGSITVQDIISLIKNGKLMSIMYPVNAMALRESQLAKMKKEYKESDPTLRRYIERNTASSISVATASKPELKHAEQLCSKVAKLANLDLKERISNAMNASPTSNHQLYLVAIKSAISEVPLLLKAQNIVLTEGDRTLVNELDKLMLHFNTKQDAEFLYGFIKPTSAMDESDDHGTAKSASAAGKEVKESKDKSASLSVSATTFGGKRKLPGDLALASLQRKPGSR